MDIQQVLLGSASLLGVSGVQMLVMGIDDYFNAGASHLGSYETTFMGQSFAMTNICNALLMYGISTNPTKSKKDIVTSMWILQFVYQVGSNYADVWSAFDPNPVMMWVWPVICVIMIALFITSTGEKPDPVPDTPDSKTGNYPWFYKLLSCLFLVNAITNAVEPTIGMALYHSNYSPLVAQAFKVHGFNLTAHYESMNTASLFQAIQVHGFNFLLWGMYFSILDQYESNLTATEHLSIAGMFMTYAAAITYWFTLGIDILDGVGANFDLFASWLLALTLFAYICYTKSQNKNSDPKVPTSTVPAHPKV